MLTRRQNFMEVIRGGNPDRFVNQYDYYKIVRNPINANSMKIMPGIGGVDGWGVTWAWPSDNPGPIPLHDDTHTVIQDIDEWRSVIHHPKLEFSEGFFPCKHELDICFHVSCAGSDSGNKDGRRTDREKEFRL